MRITKVTRTSTEPDPKDGIEVFVGEFQEVEADWYQADIASLEADLERVGLTYREYHLMRKAVGFEDGLVVGLLIWGGTEAIKLLSAWLPAREGRKVRIKFKDGAELEARTVEQLEEMRDKFLAASDKDDTIA